jgi:hypothetical protein
MVLFRRIVGELHANFLQHSLSEQERVGISGQADAVSYLNDPIVSARRSNPRVPDHRHPGEYREGDLLVYAAGNPYVVEVKNLSGCVRYCDSERIVLLHEEFGHNGKLLRQRPTGIRGSRQAASSARSKRFLPTMWVDGWDARTSRMGGTSPVADAV